MFECVFVLQLLCFTIRDHVELVFEPVFDQFTPYAHALTVQLHIDGEFRVASAMGWFPDDSDNLPEGIFVSKKRRPVWVMGFLSFDPHAFS